MAEPQRLYGCIEAGGTKFVLGVVSGSREVVMEDRLPTGSPAETLSAAVAWFRTATAAHGPLAAMGIASFGPAGVDRRRDDWGFITTTPKPGWSGTDIAGTIGRALGLTVGFDTDVTAAAIAEGRWGAARGERTAVYVTLGTGIGGGVVIDGRPLHGRSHPEMGHIPVRRDPADESFAGVCPFHADCLEGLANGPAIRARWGASLSELPDDHPGHAIIAGYVAQLCMSVEAMLSPDRIIIGGGVAKTPGLLPHVREKALALNAGYFPGFDPLRIVGPGLDERSGLYGALALAMDAAGAAPP